MPQGAAELSERVRQPVSWPLPGLELQTIGAPVIAKQVSSCCGRRYARLTLEPVAPPQEICSKFVPSPWSRNLYSASKAAAKTRWSNEC